MGKITSTEREALLSVVNQCLFQLLICLRCVQREEDVEMEQKFLYATPSRQEPSPTVTFPLSVLGQVFSATLSPPAEEYQE